MRIIILAVLMCACQAAQDPENCRPPQLQNNGFFVPNSENYRTGDKITYGCNTGLKPDLKTWWGEITCKNGDWSHTPRCIDEAWCITTHVPNAKPDVLQASRPGKYDFECDHGYWIEGGKSIAECVAGSWTLPECKRNPDSCSPPPRVNNGMITTPYRDIFENGEKLEYICARGYRLDGGRFNTCKRGLWSSTPSCVEVKCTDRPRVDYARAAEELKVSYNHGETVRFMCNSGYEFEGTDTARCEDGTWKLPVCKDITWCSAPRVPNGSPEHQSKTVYTDREYITVVCDRGYEVKNGYPYGQCVSGAWRLPVCEARAGTPCTAPSVPNAQPAETISWYPYPTGRTVTFTCNRGYEFEGTNKALCDDGAWRLPVCKHITWCSAPRVPNGSLQDRSKTVYTDREYVSVVCDRGYEVKNGYPHGQCVSGTWRLPVCEARAGTPCTAPRVPNAQPAETISWYPYPTGRTVTFTCNRGYEFEGTNKAVCDDGAWRLPVCKRAGGGGGAESLHPDQFGVLLPVSVCGSQPLIVNGDVIELPGGKELKVQCARFYKLEGPEKVGCVQEEWTELPVCKLVGGGGGGEFRPDQFGVLLPVHICGAHPLIANGDVTEMTSGMELKVQCVRLYKLDGPKTVGCVEGKWTALPVCKSPCKVEGERIHSGQSDEYLQEGEEKRYYCAVLKKITVKCLDGIPTYSQCKWTL